MPRYPIVSLVDLCTRFAWPVIAVILALAAFSAIYATQHFAIATDIKTLFPRDLPWTERAFRESATFPEEGMVVVVDAPTPELASQAAAQLTLALAADHRHFKRVEALQSSPFFVREGLLYLSAPEVGAMTARLDRAKPLIGELAADPSLRGTLGALDYGLIGVANGVLPLDALAPPMNRASATLDDVLARRPAHFSWQEMASGSAAAGPLRQFIAVQPVLDYHALEPGGAAARAVAAAARRLDLAGGYQARARVTGLVPMNDSQFAALKEHAGLNAALTCGAVLLILWLALRSWRIMLAVVINLLCGLVMSAALGLFLVGRLNLISVAFFVLFVGLGVDFGIQFAVRYRNERHEVGALRPALVAAARKAGGPLALAAAATALGFCAFVPTAYRGLSELGEIAGPGMIIAFLTSITLLPALLAVLNPAGEQRAMGFAVLAPVDRFVGRYRIPLVAATLGAVVLAAPLLYWLPFDFNPLHLQNPKAPAVATFLALRRDPQLGANAIDIVEPNLPAAERAAQHLARLPEVAQTRTLASFIPLDQQKKLADLKLLAAAIGPMLNPPQPKPAPNDAENVAAMRMTAAELTRIA
ncbi:MAG TPA: MMPL family transporter, partial [Stellaceae bacterium]|nr:MMPL family transporter [Stellaceae bacterium]